MYGWKLEQRYIIFCKIRDDVVGIGHVSAYICASTAGAWIAVRCTRRCHVVMQWMITTYL